jgi:hypothetical protein
LQSNRRDSCNKSLLIWRSCGKLTRYIIHFRLLCGNKSTVVSAPCLGSHTFVSILVPRVREKYKVNTARGPEASVRIYTLKASHT